MDEYRIWEAGFDAEGNTKPGYCTATNLVKMMPEKQSLPCSHQLGYICRQRILPECNMTGREHLSFDLGVPEDTRPCPNTFTLLLEVGEPPDEPWTASQAEGTQDYGISLPPPGGCPNICTSLPNKY
ncbi:uncharacterized protein LOC144139497 [Haemaphysalis longicornis]